MLFFSRTAPVAVAALCCAALIGLSPHAIGQSSGPGGVGGASLWLDADDRSTLFADVACTRPVTLPGSEVACWADKSGSNANVTLPRGLGKPTWLENQFRGRPALEFKKGERDGLRYPLPTPYTGPYTEFIVFQQQGIPQQYDSFFSSGFGPLPQFHQITFLNNEFRWFNNDGNVAFEPFSNDLRLYTARGDASGTEVFVDGERENTSPITSGRTYGQYRINLNRSGDRENNSKIAEVIVYHRALDDCETEDVNFYLGSKYGRDFFNLKNGDPTIPGSGWSYTAPFDNGINGIAAIDSAACSQPRVIDSALSDIVTLSNPVGFDAGERLLIANNGAGLQTEASDVPSGFDARLVQVWQIDADTAGNGVSADISFDTSNTGGAQGNSIDISNPAQLVLLIGDDPADMAAADRSPIGAVVNGTTVTFPSIPLQPEDGRFFTLAHQLPPGVFVHNAGDVDYSVTALPQVVAPALELNFPNPATQIDEAKVNIAENYQDGADVLGISGQTGTSGTIGPLPGGATLNWSFDAAIGVLSFSGSGIAQDYQQALRDVTFKSTSTNTARRKLTYSVGSGLQFPPTGNFYEFLPDAGINWNAARAAADARRYFGLQGYLATVTSQGESQFILNKLKGKQGWIGATDSQTENEWRWVTGPEGLEDTGKGRLFSQNATPVGGAYVNWQSGQPDGSGDAAYFIGNNSWAGSVPAKWDDVPVDYTTGMQGYVIEYGGLPNDPQLHLADDAFINVLLPAVTLTKTAATATANTVSDLTYTLTFENTGPADARDVRLVDVLPTSPSGATFVSASGGGTESGGRMIWNIGTLAAGASDTRTVTIRTPQTTGTMSNTATLSASDLPGDVQASETVTLVGPSLVVDVGAPAGVTVRSPIIFNVSVNNNGSGAATNSEISFTVSPTGLVFDAGASSAGCAPVSFSDPTIICDTGMIAAAGSATRTLVYTGPAAQQTVRGFAQVSADQLALPLFQSAAVYVTECTQANQACLEKSFSPGTVSIPQGQTSTLEFRLTNGTDAASRAVDFTDTLPPGVVLDGAPSASQCGGTVTGSDGGSTVTVSSATVGGSDPQSCTISVTVRGAQAGASVNGPGEFSATSNVDVSTANATLNVTAPQISLSSTPNPSSVLAGGQVIWDLSAENVGQEDAAGVEVSYDIPAGATFVDASPGFVRSGDRLTWTLGALQAGTAFSLSATTRAPLTPTTLSSTTSATASNAASASVTSTVAVTGQPNFAVAIVDTPDPVQDGSSLGYLITVTNNGPVPALASTLEVPVSANTTFVSASSGGTNTSGTVSWNLGDLGASASTSVSLTLDTVTPLANGTIINASATADASNLPTPATANAQTTVQSEPVLDVRLTATPAIVESGRALEYTVDYDNNGTDTAADTRLELNLPSGYQLNTVTGANAQVQGSTIVWPLGDLLAGQSGSFIITGVTSSGLANNSTLVASAVLSSITACGASPQPCAASALASTRIDSAPDLTLTIDATANVGAGDSLSLRLDYLNQGNQDSTGTELKLFLPPNTQFVRADSGGVCFGGTPSASLPPLPCTGFSNGSQFIVWDLGTVAVNNGGRAGATLFVRAPLADGTSLVTNAELRSTAPGAPPAITAQSTTTVVSSAVLDLKVQAPPLVSPGTQLLYEFDFLNIGTDIAPNAVLETTLPANTTFVRATGNFTQIGNAIRWDLGDVGARLSGSVNLLVDVAPTLANGTSLINNASLSSDTTPPTSVPTSTRVISAPIPTLIKTSQPRGLIAAGGSVTYTLAYGNAGDEDMLNARLVDHLPAGFVPDQIGGGGVFDAATGTVTWDLGTLVAGSQGGTHTVTINVPTGTQNGTRIVNSATLESDNSQPVAALDGVDVASNPQLTLDIAAPPQVDAGGDITYTLKYENTGNAEAFNTRIEFTLPPETTYLSATGTHAHGTNLVNWPLGNILPGGSGQLTVTARVNAPLRDGTSLFASGTVDVLNGRSAADLALTVVQSEPVLNIGKFGPPVASPGQTLDYVLLWSNTGTDRATGVVVTDTLPANTQFAAAGQGGQVSGSTVTWNLGDVPAGTSGNLDLSVTIAGALPNGTVLTNTAELNSNETPTRSSTADTSILSTPSYKVTTTSSPGSLVEAGQPVTLTIAYRNDGNEDGVNVVLTQLLPPGVVFDSATSNGATPTVSGQTIDWSLGPLPAGASGSETVVYRVPVVTANGTILPATTTLHGDNGLAASAPSLLRVDAQALLSESTTPSTRTAAPGQSVDFTVSYTNSGNSAGSGVTVTTTLPSGLTNVVPRDGGVYDPNTNTIVWNPGSVPPGGGGSLGFAAQISTATPPADGSALQVRSALSSTPSPGAPLAPPVVSSTTVSIKAPVLDINESASPANPIAGDFVTYTITYTNLGSATATQVVVEDILDPDLSFDSASNGGSFDAATGVVRWQLPDLAPGASGQLTVRARVASTVPDGTVIENRAGIDALEQNPAPFAARDSRSVSGAPATPAAIPVNPAWALGLLVAIMLLAGAAAAQKQRPRI
ncbi:conserved repeat domain protein [gamma proteobacterium NOR5-3]|nr:conserved repeat domain protein [gamma proteobacterium NOR5-3]